jgi:hypothetical protein
MHQRAKGMLKFALPSFRWASPVFVQESLDAAWVLECRSISCDVALQSKWQAVTLKDKASIAYHSEFDDDIVLNAHDKSIIRG